ncbi:MAG TPA: polysaccharide biosynthesis/export family protein [Clostridia bacterium]|nr:polysaccharide biosynthesis/export family protein [Clostridia bacterium]
MTYNRALVTILLAVVATLSCAAWAQVAAGPGTTPATPSAASTATPADSTVQLQGAPISAAPQAAAASAPDTPAQAAPGETQFADRYPRYKVRPGDAMDITFTFSPEMNQTVAVQPDGFINLKEVGDVRVQDQTTAEVRETVRKAYANTLRDPVITVVLKDFTKPYFIAGGQVLHPGKYELRDSTTVAEAVAVAGGFTSASKHSEVWVYRRLPGDRMEVKRLNMKKMLAKGDLHEDVRLQNGDMLFVPQNTFSKVKDVIVPRPTVAIRP